MSKNKREYDQQWCNDNFIKYLLYKAKTRARLKGLEFSLCETDIIIPSHCPILGIELNQGRRSLEERNNAPCIDRKDNSKGYVKNNIAVISFKANKLKGELTKDQLKALLAYVSS